MTERRRRDDPYHELEVRRQMEENVVDWLTRKKLSMTRRLKMLV